MITEEKETQINAVSEELILDHNLQHYRQQYNNVRSIPQPRAEKQSLHDEVHIYWSLLENDTIQLAVAVHLSNLKINSQSANTTTSTNQAIQLDHLNTWVGFGLSDMGGMIGSDIFIYVSGMNFVLDCHGVQYSTPLLDQCGQDWKYVNSTFISDSDSHRANSGGGDGNDIGNGWIVVEVVRSLLAADFNEDRSFMNDSSPSLNPTKAIVAWGLVEDQPENVTVLNDSLQLISRVKPHGPMNKVKADIRFFRTGLDDGAKSQKVNEPQIGQDTGEEDKTNNILYFDLIPKQHYNIPTNITTYKNFCFALSDIPEILPSDELYIVKFEDVLYENEGPSLVHHMDLHGTTNEILGADSRLCRVYMDMIHPWEAGSPRFFQLPAEAGIPIGVNSVDAYKAFRVEVHYHNPSLISGRSDRSGVRIYYSRRKPKYVAGLMLLGDPNLQLLGQPTVPNKGADLPIKTGRHSFYCPPSCFTKDTMRHKQNNKNGGDERFEGITVFKEVFHMHKTGGRMTSIQFNSTGEPIRAAEINYFDFTQGAGYSSSTDIPFKISPGDSFVTTCYFDKRGILFGSGSNEEMCQTFLWYYPKTDVRCKYYDEDARILALESGEDPDISAYGCEVSYNSSERQSLLDRDGMGDEHIGMAKENTRCNKPTKLGSRPFNDYPFSSNAGLLSSWPSLYQYTRKPTSNSTSYDISIETSTNFTNIPTSTNSSQLQSCTLCKMGAPKFPFKEIVGYESNGADTGWKCDEMDAFIPIMFSNPELVYLDRDRLPPCKNFQKYFGPMCGCEIEKEEVLLPDATDFHMTPTAFHSIALLLCISLLLLIIAKWKNIKLIDPKIDSLELAPIVTKKNDHLHTCA